MRIRTLILVLLSFSRVTWAQDPPRFSPPKPPPLDQDFEDPNEEDDAGDSPTRPGIPPAIPAGTSAVTPTPPPGPPPTDFRPITPSLDANKVRFKVVDGEYYEKGKKRGRTPPNKRMQ